MDIDHSMMLLRIRQLHQDAVRSQHRANVKREARDWLIALALRLGAPKSAIDESCGIYKIDEDLDVLAERGAHGSIDRLIEAIDVDENIVDPTWRDNRFVLSSAVPIMYPAGDHVRVTGFMFTVAKDYRCRQCGDTYWEHDEDLSGWFEPDGTFHPVSVIEDRCQQCGDTIDVVRKPVPIDQFLVMPPGKVTARVLDELHEQYLELGTTDE